MTLRHFLLLPWCVLMACAGQPGTAAQGASTSSSSGAGTSTSQQAGASSAATLDSSSASLPDNGEGLGDLCGSGGGTCADVENSACVGLAQTASAGFCAGNGCTLGTPCGGGIGQCVAQGSSRFCVAPCDLHGGDGVCGAGKACISFNGAGACAPLSLAPCSTVAMPSGCAGTEACVSRGSDGFGMCAPGCDVFGAPCGGGQSCYVDAAGNNATCAAPSETTPEGGTCAFRNACAAGLVCVFSSGMLGVCARPCDDTHMCEAQGTSCFRRVTSQVGGCVAG